MVMQHLFIETSPGKIIESEQGMEWNGIKTLYLEI